METNIIITDNSHNHIYQTYAELKKKLPPKFFKIKVFSTPKYNIDKKPILKKIENDKKNQKNKNNNINKKINRNNSESLLNFFSNEIKMTEKIKLYLGELPKDIEKEEIKNTVFCCKCGGDHFSELCGKIKNKKKNSR